MLWAFNPAYGVEFLLGHGMIGLVTLGAVFLAVTGAEALYADLGHFGRGPIRMAWLTVVLPALTINYLGQGALVLADPKAIENPFFLLYPEWALLPMVVLATAATVIASQAVITGAYSLTQQAIQLACCRGLKSGTPRSAVRPDLYAARQYAAADRRAAAGRAVPLVKRAGAAYGIAVTGTMVVTAMHGLHRDVEGVAVAARCCGGGDRRQFLLIDLTFLGANLLKVVDGGWVPLALGGLIMAVMYTWRRGSRLLFEKTRRQELPLEALVAMLRRSRRSASPARRFSSPAIPRARRPRCCTASSTTKCCTSRTSS